MPKILRYNIKRRIFVIPKNLMYMRTDFLKGTLSTMILSMLEANGKMYGYEICQKAKELSKDTIILTEGAIYPALHKLEKKGWIVSSKEVYKGRTRKYYAISSENKSHVVDNIQSLHDFLSGLHLVLKAN